MKMASYKIKIIQVLCRPLSDLVVCIVTLATFSWKAVSWRTDQRLSHQEAASVYTDSSATSADHVQWPGIHRCRSIEVELTA